MYATIDSHKLVGISPIVLSILSRAQPKYSGGEATPDHPYQIDTAENLLLLRETPDDYDKHFVLTADIDLAPDLPGCKVFERALVAPDNCP